MPVLETRPAPARVVLLQEPEEQRAATQADAGAATEALYCYNGDWRCRRRGLYWRVFAFRGRFFRFGLGACVAWDLEAEVEVEVVGMGAGVEEGEGYGLGGVCGVGEMFVLGEVDGGGCCGSIAVRECENHP